MDERAKYLKKRNLVLFTVALILMISVLHIALLSKTRVISEENISISINNIPEKEVVCVGKIKLDKNVNYVIDISTESSDKIFVALSNSDNIVNAQGVEWKQYYEINDKKLIYTFTDIETGDFYVYVGSKGGPLENIEGRLSII